MEFNYPYTDFHELNLDWFLVRFKELVEEWNSVKEDWNSLHDYVQNYFENLNVQTEIDNKINAMILDGTFADIVSPFVTAALPALVAGQLPDVVAAQISSVVATQISAVVADQLPAVAASAAAAEVGDWLAAHIDPDTGYVIDKSLTVSDAAADAKVVGDILSFVDDAVFQPVYRDSFSLVVGGIGTNGGDNTNTKRCRTDYIPLNDGVYYKLLLTSASYRIVNCHIYDSDYANIADMTNKGDSFVNVQRTSGTYYVRFSFSTIGGNDDITATDIANIEAALSLRMISDKSLTLSDVPADAKVIGEYVNYLKHSAISGLSWEVGSIGSNTGANVSATNRIRTVGYYDFNPCGILTSINDGYKYAFRLYDASKTYLGYTSFNSAEKLIDPADFTGVKYYRIVAALTDDSDIPAEDVDTVAANLTLICSNVDPTLTKKGYAADAETVGKYLNKTIKILGIGNSYTRDCLRWLWKILKEAGFNDVIVGHGYWGGSTLKDQYDSLDPDSADHTAFEYWKYTTSQDATKTASQSLDAIIADELWDVVIFQQQSDNAGQYDSFVSGSFDINDFISYLQTNISADVKIGINQTWSHAAGYSGADFISWYGGDPAVQEAAIESVIPQVAHHMTRCDYVIKTGIAVKYGRQNTYLNDIGDEMLRSDKNHLDYGIPSFMAGLVYAAGIANVDPFKIHWRPDSTDEGHAVDDDTEYTAYLAKQCVTKSVIEM